MNYKFIKKGIDDYELHFKNKEGKEVIKPFKNTIEQAKKLDSIQILGKMRLFDTLKIQGKTKDDYIAKKIVNGKTIIDESAYNELESQAIETVSAEVLSECIEASFGEDTDSLLEEMGINTDGIVDHQHEFMTFVAKYTAIITGKDVESPSGEVYYRSEQKS